MGGLRNLVHIIGGSNSAGEQYADGAAVDLSTMKVVPSPLPPLPHKLMGHCSEVMEGKIYVFGGFTDINDIYNTTSDEVLVLAPKADQWTALEGSRMASKRCLFSSCIHNGKIVVIGGFDGQANVQSCEQFDPKTNKWEKLPALLEGGYGCSIASNPNGKNLFASLGQWDKELHMLEVGLYEPGNMKLRWKSQPQCICPRNGSVAFFDGDKFYVLGGDCRNGRSKLGYPVVEKFCTKEMVWVKVEVENAEADTTSGKGFYYEDSFYYYSDDKFRRVTIDSSGDVIMGENIPTGGIRTHASVVTCFHLYLVYDKFSNIIKSKVTILCLVLTGKAYKTSRDIPMKLTWLTQCNDYIFFSSVEDESLPAIKTTKFHGYQHSYEKVKNGILAAHKKFGDKFDWIYRPDNDVFASPNNLRMFLMNRDPEDDRYYYGWRATPLKIGPPELLSFTSGGTGYVFGRGAFRKLVKKGLNKDGVCPAHSLMYEDRIIGVCAQRLNMTIKDSRDYKGRDVFVPSNVNHYATEDRKNEKWVFYTKYSYYKAEKGIEFLGDYPISFHYVEKEEKFIYKYILYNASVAGLQSRISRYQDKRKMSVESKADEIFNSIVEFAKNNY
uniref:N-acetylgalactosaminide beta-1,3-galactosyltransferase n=1 Tax=Rhabditophanes sp. KR3021 TaxID=114890 RepID=A0AC35TG72_9BILA